MTKVTPFMMFNDQLESAIEFYTNTFPDSKVVSVSRAGPDGPVTGAEFIVGGQKIMAYNGDPGGSYFQFSDGFSLFVQCEDQKEIDTYWSKILQAGGKESKCGWIIDPFGARWQIVPRRFMELAVDKDPKKAKAVMGAMLKMVKMDIAELERAHRNA